MPKRYLQFEHSRHLRGAILPILLILPQIFPFYDAAHIK